MPLSEITKHLSTFGGKTLKPKISKYKFTTKEKDKRDRVSRANIYLNQGYNWSQIRNVVGSNKFTLLKWAKELGMKLQKEER